MIEVGERIEENRLRVPRQLDARAQLTGKPRGLANVASYDFLIHRRDPVKDCCSALSRGSKKAFQVWRSTRKAGSRQRILLF